MNGQNRRDERYPSAYRPGTRPYSSIRPRNSSGSAGSRSGYGSGENRGYADRGRSGYGSGENRGYADRSRNGYGSGENRGYADRGRSGYGSGENRGYADRSRNGYGSGENRGYADRSRSGYGSGENRGYADRSRSGYGSGENRSYADRSRGGYGSSENRSYGGGARPTRSAQPRSAYGAHEESRGGSRPAGTRNQTAARRQGAPAQRRRAPKKGGKNPIVMVFKAIALVFLALFAGIGKLFSALNRKLDVFRRGEASTVIVNSIVGGVVVMLALCVLMACKPGIDSARARACAASGSAEKAMKLVNSLETSGYDAQKLEKTREAVVAGFIKSGKYDEASAVLSEMAAGATKSGLEQQNNYAHAAALYESGDYTEAAQLFYQLDTYEDSALRYADCRCALAIQAWQAGNESSAHSLLLDVPDAVERVATAAHRVAGSEAEAQTILAADIFSAESLTQMEQTMENLAAARSDMPEGRIAAGKRHTVAVTGSGTVLAAGDNSYGQCDVSAWSGVRQVAAGAYHSVALRSDGTVLAAGDNSQNQCDVSGWTDIVAIAAASYDTIGLKADGSVVACGMHSSLVSGWHNVTFVAGGSYSLGCLYDKGAMLSSHKGAQMDLGVVLYDLSICGQVSVGVLYDGTMVSSFDGAPAWDGMVTVTACESGILGIDVNGQVRAHFYRPGDGVEISVPARATEVESSGTHHVVLTEDGRVYAFGNNDYGQCEVSGWQL